MACCRANRRRPRRIAPPHRDDYQPDDPLSELSGAALRAGGNGPAFRLLMKPSQRCRPMLPRT